MLAGLRIRPIPKMVRRHGVKCATAILLLLVLRIMSRHVFIRGSVEQGSLNAEGFTRMSWRGAGNVQQTPLSADQEAIVEMMLHAWSAYKSVAWGKDTLRPISGTYETWFNTGLTIIDSIDSLWLMNLTDEYKAARHWAETSLDLAQNHYVNVFECTIRCLGGFLSAYALSGDILWLKKAEDLGGRLLPAFRKHASGLPTQDVNLKTGDAKGSEVSTSEATTLLLEFRTLAYYTGRSEFAEVVERVMDVVRKNLPKDKLVTLYMNPVTGGFIGNTKSLGARADSFYEYLLKAWLLSGRTDERWRKWYVEEAQAVNSQLVKTNFAGMTYLGELRRDSYVAKMDHLCCFYPGVLALGSLFDVSDGAGQRNLKEAGHDVEHLTLAKELTDTCFEMYNITNLKLGPEIAHFDGSSVFIKPNDAHSLLRPEAVEAFFIMYRVTKDKKYRNFGRRVYTAINKHARVENGFASVRSANAESPMYIDKMESFFLAETLKYLFLLFSEDESFLRLDRWVLNTEAHPLPVQDSEL
ncbi:hypothetical protein NDN08_004005 [Rhodosorus marinus]|uniref:alpha-1,2-Mannosidase n=1 Tax=Rhodosorus marinus TaxID=101924 RepID=A0AAV8UH16_9RHOD|nr:hypothetical protein NDN08_004005 [Rhodosorus marinus]